MESLNLPPGFVSWSEVLAESAISRAFPDGNSPACLARTPELLAPLARELAGELRERLFTRRVTAARMLEAQLIEQAFGRLGNATYGHTREVMETAQQRFFEHYRENADSPERQSRQVEMQRAQGDFERIRSRHAPAVRRAIDEALAAHWLARPINRMSDTIFADAAFTSPASRLGRIHPTWWGRFFGRLQVLSGQGHPAHGELLDALPRLTRAPGRCTIEGAIYEWRQARNRYWGWDGPENPWVLSKRSAEKARKLTRWYRGLAPGFLEDLGERRRLHALLAERLAAVDPWDLPSGHGPGRLVRLHGQN